MTTIYVLKLQEGKYYVGKSDVPQSRIAQHFASNGSEWTKKYTPLDVVECVAGDAFDEDKVTKQYMAQYGIDAVRGGTYCQLHLPGDQLSTLQKELMTVQGRCFRCGQPGHFSGQCVSKPALVTTRRSATTVVCYRCGTPGHYANNCYAGRHQYGKPPGRYYYSSSDSDFSSDEYW